MGEPRRSEALGRLLREANSPEVLPWQRIEAIVAAAPPARVPWHAVLTAPQSMRYALGGAMALVLVTGTLAVIPAQAEHVATIISAQMPSAWQPGSDEMSQLKVEANSRFEALALPASELYILNTQQSNGRPELAMVMQNVDAQQASALYDGLAGKFPALAAYEPKIEAVEGDSAGSLLAELFSRIARPDQMSGMSTDEARIHVLEALSGMGLTPTEVKATRAEDGTLIIDISAQMQIQVKGHTQEELRSVGLSRETLGENGFKELLEAAQAN
jgi:hypothetical protein